MARSLRETSGKQCGRPFAGGVALRGLSANVERIAERLVHEALGRPDGIGTARPIRQLLDQIDAGCRRCAVRTPDLTPRSRRQLAWLRFLSAERPLAEVVEAIGRATAIFSAAAPVPRWRRPLRVYFLPTQSMYRVRSLADGTRILLPTPMITFGDADFTRLGRAMFERRRREDGEQLHALMLGDAYQRVRRRLERLAGVVDQARGAAHNLNDSFDRVNRSYFSGQMARPHLSWSRAMSTSRFGFYKYASDTVTISRALDLAQVPSFVIDHVMHHELLHKKHGLRWRQGRGHAHTAEFREEERQFARFREADQFLRRLATSLARRRPNFLERPLARAGLGRAHNLASDRPRFPLTPAPLPTRRASVARRVGRGNG